MSVLERFFDWMLGCGAEFHAANAQAARERAAEWKDKAELLRLENVRLRQLLEEQEATAHSLVGGFKGWFESHTALVNELDAMFPKPQQGEPDEQEKRCEDCTCGGPC